MIEGILKVLLCLRPPLPEDIPMDAEYELLE